MHDILKQIQIIWLIVVFFTVNLLNQSYAFSALMIHSNREISFIQNPFDKSDCSTYDLNLKDAFMCDRPEIVELWIDSGADIDVPLDDNGETPLMIARYFGSYAVVVLLLKAGANVCHSTKAGRNVLYYAMESGSSDVISLLEFHFLFCSAKPEITSLLDEYFRNIQRSLASNTNIRRF